MNNEIKQEQLKSTISNYNLYCKDNVQKFLFNNVNFQEVVLQIESYIKKGEHQIANKLTERLFTDEFIWGFIFADLSNLDLTSVPVEHLIRIPFSTLTKWPSREKLPVGFEPNQIINLAKQNKSDRLDKLHKEGISGKNVKVAYLDSPFDIGHKAFDGINIEYNAIGKQDLHFHGYAVTDRLTNVAPNTHLIYFGCGEDEQYKSQAISKIKALKQILNRVENGEDIVAVGMSTTLEEALEKIKDNEIKENAIKRLNKIKDRLEELGVEFLDSPAVLKDFNYACKRNPVLDNEDFNNYLPYCDINYKNKVHLLEADRLRPLPCTSDGYVYENNLGCASWTIPQIVGCFCLAKQVDKELRFYEFVEICKATTHSNDHGLKIMNAEEMINEVQYRLQKREENRI